MEITFVGTNFGWAADATLYDATLDTTVTVSATYSNGIDGITYNTSDCAVVVPNTVINCTAAPGVGFGHIWTLSVDATVGGAASVWTVSASSSDFETSYKAPVLTAVEGADGMPTIGGRTVTITGENFGPASLGDVVRVTYGRSEATVDEFKCAGSTVTDDSVRIECTTVAGIGAPLHWQVAAGIKESGESFGSNPTLYSEAMKESASGYLPPSIGNVTAILLDTKGGETVTLSGSNFGPSDLTNISATYGGHDFTKYTADGCKVTVDHMYAECTSVPGVGANLSWSLVVGGQRSEGPSVGSVSYRPPIIAPKVRTARA